MTKPSLHAQADAVALASANLRGHIDNLQNLVNRGRRPAHELEHARSQYPALNAAANTLAFMEKHESEIRKMIEGEK